MFLTIKLQYGTDIRRVTLDELNSYLSVSDLFLRIKSMYAELAEVPSEKLFVKYQDEDGDSIRITNDLEFTEAVSSTKEVNGAKLLRLTITCLQSPTLSHNNNPCAPTIAGDSLNDILTSALAQLGNNSSENSGFVPHIVNSVLTNMQSVGAASANSAAGLQQDPLPNLIRNIASALPAEQITPIVTNLMQSPAIQQMIPQLLSAFFGVPQQQQKTETASVHTSTVPTAVSSVSTSTPSGEIGMVDASTETAYAVSDRSTNTTVSTTSHVKITATINNNGSVDSDLENVEDKLTPKDDGLVEQPPADCVTNEQTVDSTPTTPVVSFAGSKFGALLLQLQELGFTDNEKNVAVLVKHGGDFDKSIDELVADQ